MMERFTFLLVMVISGGALYAQTPMLTDAMMTPRKDLGAGIFYGYDSWTNYWEGTLKRDNGNIGTLTTQSASWMGVYGINSKVTVIGMLPYVWTKPSGGTLAGQKGIQDLTLAGKYNFLTKEVGSNRFSAFVLGSFSAPMSNYTPDFLPMSIGLASKNFSSRLTLNYVVKQTWYATASGAYTWRSNITLDRPSYYADQFYSTDQVDMPNTFDFIVRAGYQKETWTAELYFTQQNTLGGGDIRRQDMPFPSYKMNYSKVGASLLWMVPKFKNLALRAWGGYTVAGRNVGQSVSVMTGFMYTFHFGKQTTTE